MGLRPFRESAYYQQAKAIKGYVTFAVPLNRKPTAHTIRKVREYFQLLHGKPIRLDDGTKDWITGVAQGGKYPVRLKGRKLKAAQRYAGHGSVKGLRVAFVPWDGKHAPTLDFDGDTVLDTTGGQNRAIFLFGVDEDGDKPAPDFVEDMVAGDYLKHVSRAIREAKGCKAFGIMCGLNETRELYDRSELKKRVVELVEAYSNESANNWAGNWLRGIIGYRTKTVKGALTFRQRRNEYVTKQRKARANEKRKEKRKRARNRRH